MDLTDAHDPATLAAAAEFSATPIAYRGLDEMRARAADIPNDYYAEKLVAAFTTRAGKAAALSDFESRFDDFDTKLMAAVPILGLGYPRARRMMDALRTVVVG